MIELFVLVSIACMIFSWKKSHSPNVTYTDLNIMLAGIAVHTWFLWYLAWRA